ncbi:DZI1L protein, partial [Centropus bengalensis]|nr:DZI1L protein [Centropus bengalensis]
AVGMPGTPPGLTIPVDIPPFHFQPCWLSVDWRRLGAIDVERVAREVDVATLQEHISSVTFCSLEWAPCPRCGQPADPVLLKVLRMAQLSIEYLLHCQEHLGTSLATHAQCLRATRAQLACAQQQLAEQAAQLRRAKEESRAWKKLIATQQLLLQAGPSTYCKEDSPAEAKSQQGKASCTLAHKASVPLSFAEQQKMKQVEQMEEEVEKLKAELQETQQQLQVEREAEKLHREQEKKRTHQQEEGGRRDCERWKEEERMKLHEEIDGLRQLFLTAFKDMASRSSAMEVKMQELQARAAAGSNLGTLQSDATLEATEEAQGWARSWAEQERMAAQVRVPSVLTPTAHSWRRIWMEMGPHPCTCVKLPPSQGRQPERNRFLGLGLVGPTSTKKRDHQPGLQALPCVESPAPTFAPDREKAALGGKQRLLEALERNPNLLKQFRPILEEMLEEKLESMGIKRVVKGISTPTYRSLQALVRLQQQQKAELLPSLLRLRQELARAVMGKIRRCRKPSRTWPRQLS